MDRTKMTATAHFRSDIALITLLIFNNIVNSWLEWLETSTGMTVTDCMDCVFIQSVTFSFTWEYFIRPISEWEWTLIRHVHIIDSWEVGRCPTREVVLINNGQTASFITAPAVRIDPLSRERKVSQKNVFTLGSGPLFRFIYQIGNYTNAMETAPPNLQWI